MGGYRFPIKKMDSSNVDEKLIILIPVLAKIYGGRSLIDTVVQFAMIKSIKDNFGHYGLEEIEHALQLWSLGKIGNKTTELYGGEFNVLILNKILSIYEDYRREVVNDAIKEEKENKILLEMENKKKEGQNDIQKTTNEDLIKEVEKCGTWEEIPKWVCDQIIKRKMIELNDDQKKEYKKRSIEIGKQKEKTEKETALLNYSGLNLKEEINRIERINSEFLPILVRLVIFENI